jgi:hypothetical protein
MEDSTFSSLNFFQKKSLDKLQPLFSFWSPSDENLPPKKQPWMDWLFTLEDYCLHFNCSHFLTIAIR